MKTNAVFLNYSYIFHKIVQKSISFFSILNSFIKIHVLNKQNSEIEQGAMTKAGGRAPVAPDATGLDSVLYCGRCDNKHNMKCPYS